LEYPNCPYLCFAKKARPDEQEKIPACHQKGDTLKDRRLS
jgi:hypothetical protein